MQRGLIGFPLGHSYSKIIQEYLTDVPYELHQLPSDEFDSFMEKRDFDGINVTIPYKQRVIPYLDEIDEQAKRIGAVNCIVNKDGKLYGHNTDYDGFKWSLSLHNIDLSNKKVVILGTGGASKAVYAAVCDGNPSSVFKVSRTGKDGAVTYEEFLANHKDTEVIINTTPVGMYPNMNEAAISIDGFDNLYAVIDVVYNPLRTEFVMQAVEKGIKAIGGIEMLVGQAYIAAMYFSGEKIPFEKVNKCLHNILNEKLNIVFIGMPGAGKSTVAAALAEKLGYSLMEMDERIVQKAGMPITEIFAKYGESKFREMETQVAQESALLSKHLISCGGGIIKKKENMIALRKNGITFFLERDLDLLETSSSRPLSSNRKDLEKLYNERIDLYRHYADVTINNNDTLEETINTIIEKMEEILI